MVVAVYNMQNIVDGILFNFIKSPFFENKGGMGRVHNECTVFEN